MSCELCPKKFARSTVTQSGQSWVEMRLAPPSVTLSILGRVAPLSENLSRVQVTYLLPSTKQTGYPVGQTQVCNSGVPWS